MKIAIISDAHGNKLFFNQCLLMIENLHVDKIVALGDYFGYMRGGNEIVKQLVSHDAILLKGNHEGMLLGELPLDEEKEKLYGLREDLHDLRPDSLFFLENMKEQLVLEDNGSKMLFLHGSPEDPLCGYTYENDVENKFTNKDKEYEFIFMGHTHRSFVKRYMGTTFVNVGSCGLPRDCGLQPSFCLFDSKISEPYIVKIRLSQDILDSPEYKALNPSIYKVFLRGCENEN